MDSTAGYLTGGFPFGRASDLKASIATCIQLEVKVVSTVLPQKREILLEPKKIVPFRDSEVGARWATALSHL